MAAPQSPNPPRPAQPAPPAGAKEIRRRPPRAAKPAVPVAVPIAKPVAEANQPAPTPPAEIPPFHPTLRPPTAVLTIFDDGKPDGEVIRLRGDRFIIGRTEGDFLIPHDEQISSSHVEITRQQVDGKWRWVVTDLHSMNGLFHRVSRTTLADRAEFLVGRGRYRFEQGGVDARNTVDDVAPPHEPSGTHGWDEAAPRGSHPALAEIVGGGIGDRVVLTKLEYWIGSAPACALCRTGDPFVAPQHARIYRDDNGVWNVQNNKTLNGVWLKVLQATVDDLGLFQIGEQRFRLKVGD